jgi:hypothetical protein
MKSIFAFLLFVLPLTISAQTNTTAIEYNDHIVELQNRIGYKMVSFNEEVGKNDATYESVKVHLEDLLLVTQTVIKETEKIPAHEKNITLRNSALDLFKFYETTIKFDYSKMIELLFVGELTEAKLADLQVILEKVTNDEKVYDERFQSEQQKFAEKYGFTLEENELQQQIDSEE